MRIALSLKIGISGVRGIVGDSLTPQLAVAFAQAFGTYIGGGRVIVGRDARPSGTMLEQAVISGLLAVGCQPVDSGICPIPSFLVLTKDAGASGGISITASHNPKEWNGMKFASRNGLYLTPHEFEEFLDIYHQGDFSLEGPERFKTMKTELQPTLPHLKKLLSCFDSDLIRSRKFKVALDCANGAGAVLAPRILEELGCRVVLLNAVPDGSFAHHAEPLPENIAEISRAVKDEKADIGFVQDADADRLSILDEKGRPLGEEMTLALAVHYILSRKRGSVVCNLSTTRAIDDIAAARKARVFRTKIGEINVVEKLLTIHPKPVVAGEGNGGVIFPDVHPCRDSFAAMCLILECLAKTGETVSSLQRKIPKYAMVRENIEGSAEQANRLVRLLKKKYEGKGKINLLDGLKVDFPEHWIHIRPSNTEPVIRLIAEAKTAQKAQAALRRLKKEIAGLEKKI
jgi:phosphomannomutase